MSEVMHDVFISYKSEDSADARKVRDALEANEIRCWMAERDIRPGSNYARDIPSAILNCKHFVLILTERSQNSPWVYKELDRAISARKNIIPIKFGYFELNNTITFLLTGIQYIDGADDPNIAIRVLIRRIQGKNASMKWFLFFKKLRRLAINLLILWLLYYYRFWILEKLAEVYHPYQSPTLAFLTELFTRTTGPEADAEFFPYLWEQIQPLLEKLKV